MDTVRRKRRDFFQNIAIVVLMLSAVALFVQTQLYNLNQDNDYFRSLSAGSTASQSAPTSLADLSAPVRIAVTGDHHRQGIHRVPPLPAAGRTGLCPDIYPLLRRRVPLRHLRCFHLL